MGLSELSLDFIQEWPITNHICSPTSIPNSHMCDHQDDKISTSTTCVILITNYKSLTMIRMMITTNHQWIGLRENFTPKAPWSLPWGISMGFRFKFSLKPIHWNHDHSFNQVYQVYQNNPADLQSAKTAELPAQLAILLVLRPGPRGPHPESQNEIWTILWRYGAKIIYYV